MGTHLGTFSDEDSRQYMNAISFAVKNGVSSVDMAINYRGMRSEKDIGKVISHLISSGEVKREDVCISTKAGLLFGDITGGLNPMKYLHEVLEPKGIRLSDFCEYHKLYQTLNPDFYEIALQASLRNLRIDTIDVYYVHIPEITRSQVSEEEFYHRIAKLFAWYEAKVQEGNQMPYNIIYPYAATIQNQSHGGERLSLIDASRKMGLKVIGSMPLICGKGFEKYTLKEMVSFALNGVDAVNIGSRNVKHIQEILEMIQTQE